MRPFEVHASLVVSTECLADKPKVGRRLNLCLRAPRHLTKFERPLIARPGIFVTAQRVKDDGQVLSCRCLELSIFEDTSDPESRLQVREGLVEPT